MATANLFQNVYRADHLHFWDGQDLNYRKVAAFLNLSRAEISSLSGVAKSSVRYDDKIPDAVRDRLQSIANVCNIVYDYFGDTAKTALWFKTANPMLGNLSPQDMVRFGRYKKLLRFITVAVEEERVREKRKQEISRSETKT
jgi:Protein of unknown function (DUF2384)